MVYIDYAFDKRIPKDSVLWYKEVIESNGTAASQCVIKYLYIKQYCAKSGNAFAQY